MIPTTPVAHLVSQIDARLVCFCLALLTIDVFFVAVFAFHEVYALLYKARLPLLGDQWDIEHDGSYAEIFGYIKLVAILFLLISIPRVWQRPTYLVFVAIFTFILLDDALRVHERIGLRIEEALALQRFEALMRIDPGQLLVWMIVGVPLLALLVATLLRAPETERPNHKLLLAALAVLVLFAVGADLAHVILKKAFRGADDLFIVIEDGGEQITLSLICCLVILIRRHLRQREPGILRTS